MVWKTSYNAGLGQPAIALAGVDTVQRVAIGTIVKGFDDALGEGEFIYLPGVAASAIGDAVVFDLLPSGPTVVRLGINAQANSGRSVAWAVAAVPAGSYGWYQISGCVIGASIAGTAVGACFTSATVGAVSSSADAGDQILGARISSAVGTPAALQSYLTVNRPMMQSQIT